MNLPRTTRNAPQSRGRYLFWEKQRRPNVPWRKIVGLRNILAHGYWVIDTEELWDVAQKKIPQFLAELRPLLDPTN